MKTAETTVRSRAWYRRVPCPRCGAPPGEQCISSGKYATAPPKGAPILGIHRARRRILQDTGT